jgi:hypothetical protein
MVITRASTSTNPTQQQKAEKLLMKAPNVMRTILASAVVALLISTTHRSTAAELEPLVVIGIPMIASLPGILCPLTLETLRFYGSMGLSDSS